MNASSLHLAIEGHEAENGVKPKTIIMDLHQHHELTYSCMEMGITRGWELDEFEDIPITIFGDGRRTLDMRGR